MNAKQRKLLLLGVALLLLGAIKGGMIYWYLQKQQAAPPAPQALLCRELSQPCALPDGGALRFVSQPENGKPFLIRLEGVQGGEPTVEFAMVGMDMGFNRYRFLPEGADWQAKVTLPVCATGSREWLATFALNGKRYSLPFTVR
ncbi:hypothetical protein [uncultured Aquitalea sp.]|uniref:hypothetical protein n=1 Tax=uncultured Aquitalea sp. TaxID=540272 RepID=UPI0025FF4336|nr:hypothetical protein [uncultured Aquitalea sp.]